MKTSELTGKALDRAVAMCEGKPLWFMGFSTEWEKGGPIIEREGIDVLRDGAHWTALKTATAHHPHIRKSGSTPLIAAMRCFVASKLGDEIFERDEQMIKKMNVWQVKATSGTDTLKTGEYPDYQNGDNIPIWVVFNAHFAERDRANEVHQYGCTNFPHFNWSLEGFYADDEMQVDMQFDDLFNATGVTK